MNRAINWNLYLQLGKFVDVADSAVIEGVNRLTVGEVFFDEFFKVLTVLHIHKIPGVIQLCLLKKGLGMGGTGAAV